MNEISVTDVLTRMRALQIVGGMESPAGSAQATSSGGPEQFGNLLRAAVDEVNQVQQHAGQLQDRFLAGDRSVELPQVVVAQQQARISFETLLQTRNRIIEAYHEIMRMPI